jgi:hypothetical protein
MQYSTVLLIKSSLSEQANELVPHVHFALFEVQLSATSAVALPFDRKLSE